MECDSGAGNPQQSSRAQGSRGSPAQLRTMESGGRVSKTDSGAFHSGGRWSCGLLPRRVSLCRMQLQEARFGPPVRRGLCAERPSWLRGHGWGLGAEGFARPILIPHEGEPVGSGFRAPETPSKAAVPMEPGAGPPRFALWIAEGRGRKRLALLSGSEARGGCGWLPEDRFPLQNAAARSSFGAVGVTGPRR